MGGDDERANHIADLEEEQINLGKTELAAKKQNLFQTRLDILKSHGREEWSPRNTAGLGGASGGSSQFPPGIFGKARQ